MLIRCVRCGSGYDFPVEQLPAEGLRAKCATCGQVSRILPGGRVESEGASELAPEVVSVQRLPREEEAVPSIIVDMVQLGDSVATPAEPPRPVDTSAFAPLATPARGLAELRTSQVTTRPRVRTLDEAPSLEPVELGPMSPVRPPRLWGLVVVALAVVVSFGLFVAWRNDFGPIWTAPGKALAIAFGGAPDAQAPAGPKVIEAEAQKGELKVERVALRKVSGPKGSIAVASGVLVNDSNRTQLGISLEASISAGPGAVPVAAHVAACCEILTDAQVLEIARSGSAHPHLQGKMNTAVKLAPGEEKPFDIIVLGDISALSQPLVTVGVKGSEPAAPGP